MKNKTLCLQYASLFFALTLCGQLYHTFSYSYYVDKEALITLNMATLAKIIFVFVDGLNDVIFSYLSEKTKSKYGKRLPWVIGAIPFFPLFIMLTFFVNSSLKISTTGFFIYYVVISVLFENISTILYVNIGALYPLLFEGNDRSIVASFKHVFEVLGVGLCIVLTPLLEPKFGYIGVGFIYGLVYIIIMIPNVSSLKHDYTLDYREKNVYSFKKTIKDFFLDKSLILYHLSTSFVLASLSILITLYPMYCKYVLQVTPAEQSILMIVLFVGVLLSILIWYRLTKKYPYRKCFILSRILFPFALYGLIIPNSFLSGLITLIAVSPLLGGVLIMPDLMNAQIIDIDKKKHQVSREASFMSLGTLLQRVSIMISSLFMTIAGSFLGYESGANPGPNPSLTFKIMCGALLPTLALIGTILAILFVKKSKNEYELYKIEKENSKD